MVMEESPPTPENVTQQHVSLLNNTQETLMNKFKLHTLDSAPAGSSPILDAAKKALGFIPNLYAHLAESPSALQAYKQLGTLLELSAFTPEEQQTILISVSVENRCEYCVAAHSFIARNMVKVANETLSALRNGQSLPNKKLNALASFAKAVVRERGLVADSQELKEFFAAGYTQQHALEVVLGVAMKTLSNYANHLTSTPLDTAFAGESWKTPSDNACCNH
jgi:AhpD family alkylhydroperoxidase